MSPQMEGTTLHNQLVSGIKYIEESSQASGVCEAHWPMVNGVKLLLECQKASIEEREGVRVDRAKEAKERRNETIAIALGVAAVAATLITVVVPLFKK